MEVQFKCLRDGLRYYSVVRNSLSIFVGTQGECDRFIAIHNEKVAREKRDALKTPRNQPVSVKTYRQRRAQA